MSMQNNLDESWGNYAEILKNGSVGYASDSISTQIVISGS